MRGLPEDRALGDLEAGFNYLAARSDVDPQRIGSIGRLRYFAEVQQARDHVLYLWFLGPPVTNDCRLDR